MKILVLSHRGDSLPLALRMEQEGHEISFYMACLKDSPRSYEGMLKSPLITGGAWRGKLKWADFVVFDCNTGMEEMRQVVWRLDIPAFNACYPDGPITIAGKTFKPWDFLLATEEERAWGHDLLEYLKIGKQMKREEFTDVAKASEFVAKNKGQYVVKIEGNADADSDATYLGITEDGEDVVKYLATYAERAGGDKVKKIELEKKIKGIEIACGGYFNGEKFVCVDVNFEHKKFLETPYSFLTGEMGTIIRLVRGHKLYDETLAKMVPFLKSIDFRGNVDINCIVNAEGLFPLEFTFGRFGYPAIYIEMEGHKKPWGEFLYACATRKDIEDPGSKESKWLIGVVIAGQGYPFYKDAGADKMNLMPVILGSGPEEKETMKHVQLCDICAVGPKKDIYTINAYVGCATAAGETIDDAQDKVYAMLPKIKVPNTYYRIDIGDRVINEMVELEDLGYGFAESEEEEKE